MRNIGVVLLVLLATVATAWGFMYTTGDYLGPGIDYRPLKSVFVGVGTTHTTRMYYIENWFVFLKYGYYVHNLTDTIRTKVIFHNEYGEQQEYLGLSLPEILEKVANEIGGDAIVGVKYDTEFGYADGNAYYFGFFQVTGTAVKILDTGVSTEPQR